MRTPVLSSRAPRLKLFSEYSSGSPCAGFLNLPSQHSLAQNTTLREQTEIGQQEKESLLGNVLRIRFFPACKIFKFLWNGQTGQSLNEPPDVSDPPSPSDPARKGGDTVILTAEDGREKTGEEFELRIRRSLLMVLVATQGKQAFSGMRRAYEVLQIRRPWQCYLFVRRVAAAVAEWRSSHWL